MRLLRRRDVLAPILTLAAAGALRAQDTASTRRDQAAARPADTTAAQAPRIVLPPPLPPPWRFQLDFGFQENGGNTDLTVGNASFAIERRPQSHLIVNFKLDARYGRSNGLEAVNDQKVRMRFDWQPKQLVSPFLGVDASRDIIRFSALKSQIGLGANINVDEREASRTLFSVGLVLEHEIFTPAETLLTEQDHRRYLLRFQTTRLLRQTTRIELVGRVQPSLTDGGDYLASVEAAVRVSLTRKMGLTTKFDWSRNSRPVPGVREDDRALVVALSFAW